MTETGGAPSAAKSEKTERRLILDSDQYFNAQYKALPVQFDPGDVRCSDSDKEMFVAFLGTGVAVTLFERDLRIGAACYTLLPAEVVRDFPDYKDAREKVLDKVCAPVLGAINEMKKRGAGKNRIITRLFGGTALPGDTLDAGTKNYILVREYLHRKGLKIINEDLGGPFLRRLYFFPESGRAMRCMLRRAEDFERIAEIEKRFRG